MSSSAPVIRVKGLGKRYQLGATVSNDMFREDLMRLLRYLLRLNRQRREKNEIWALKDVSFDVHQGEVIGVIGRNGAGKSTLLKILTRITDPTEGEVRLRGRVASLLEVGTGFHPELTGRENIFLNGAILGMTRVEIRSKFDEIVDFSGVEKFIDTPVKRYSSGMYVRLAFAVAAHLEPEILLVDEVLAVGDFEFQKKCLGKMGEVAQGGRTVLFVSHNMTAIEGFCESAILLQEGQLAGHGPAREIVENYLSQYNSQSATGLHVEDDTEQGFSLAFEDMKQFHVRAGDPITLRYTVVAPTPISDASAGLIIYDSRGHACAGMSSKFQGITGKGQTNTWHFVCDMGKIPLCPGNYTLKVYIGEASQDLATFNNTPLLQVDNNPNLFESNTGIPQNWGVFHWQPEWSISDEESD